MGSSGRSSATITQARGEFTTGDITATNVGSTWTQAGSLLCPVPAAAGDYLLFIPSLMVNPAGVTHVDIAVKVGAAFVRFASSGDATSALEGDPGLYGDPTYSLVNGGVMDFVVTADDVSGGNVTFAVVYMGTGTSTIIHASANYPFRWRAINFGPI